MSFFSGGSEHSSGGMMLLPKVHQIRESSNENPFHHYNGSNVTNGHVSSILACDVATVGGMAYFDSSNGTPIGGVVTVEGGLHPEPSVHSTPWEDEA